MVALKRTLLTFGLILFLLGVIVASSSSITAEHRWQTEVGRVNGDWVVSSSFKNGDNVTLDVAPGEAWGYIFSDPGDTPLRLPLNISLVAPDNGETIFQVFFEGIPPQFYNPLPGQGLEDYPIYIYNITLLRLDDSLLVEENPLEQIGGITAQTGVYTARVLRDGFWWAGPEPQPPRSLIFYKEEVAFSHPYTILLPIGGTLCAFGAVISILSVKSPTRMKDKRRRRRR